MEAYGRKVVRDENTRTGFDCVTHWRNHDDCVPVWYPDWSMKECVGPTNTQTHFTLPKMIEGNDGLRRQQAGRLSLWAE